MAANVVLLAFGAFWVVQLVKTVLPWPLQAWTKQLGALATTILSGFLFDLDTPDRVVTAIAAAGLAAFIHQIHRWMGAMGDEARISVVAKAGRRPRI